MKIFPQTILILGIGFISAIAQDQNGINPPEKNPEIVKIKGFLRNDSDRQPFTDEEVQKFCDYIKDNPIVKELEINDEVALRKIKVAQSLYRAVNDENQKKKILSLMMDMFTEIQVARDALGVDPLSRTESWLYVGEPLPKTDPKDFKDLKGKMADAQQRMNANMHKENLLSKKISDLQSIHGYLHRAITVQMKIPLPEISPKLERSPAEKARTKDFLEKQAAALGRKSPSPKDPVNHDK